MQLKYIYQFQTWTLKTHRCLSALILWKSFTDIQKVWRQILSYIYYPPLMINTNRFALVHKLLICTGICLYILSTHCYVLHTACYSMVFKYYTFLRVHQDLKLEQGRMQLARRDLFFYDICSFNVTLFYHLQNTQAFWTSTLLNFPVSVNLSWIWYNHNAWIWNQSSGLRTIWDY